MAQKFIHFLYSCLLVLKYKLVLRGKLAAGDICQIEKYIYLTKMLIFFLLFGKYIAEEILDGLQYAFLMRHRHDFLLEDIEDVVVNVL